MSKVCIVFDRLRAEEKMLQKEAAELGHDTVMLDAKITQVNTDSKKEDFDLGDVVLERCVSYFRGLHFTASLEFMDIPVLNKFDVASVCGNKMFMTLLLKKAGVPTPKTHFSFTSESASDNLEKV
ncbi:MAG: lysine biosynthesis enzyme LysX, partial [Nitrosopumilaceae archaeon]|nr:lysine biosynthesis enzyme LysX [Nitrosopumilaceae archaeon]